MSYLLMPRGGAGLNINAQNVRRFRRWQNGSGMNDYLQVGDYLQMGDNLLDKGKALYEKVVPKLKSLYTKVTDQPLDKASDGDVVVPGNPVMVAAEESSSSGVPWGLILAVAAGAFFLGGMRR